MVEVSHKRVHNKWLLLGGWRYPRTTTRVSGRSTSFNSLISDGNEQVNSMLIKFTDNAKLGNITHVPQTGKAIMSPEEV